MPNVTLFTLFFIEVFPNYWLYFSLKYNFSFISHEPNQNLELNELTKVMASKNFMHHWCTIICRSHTNAEIILHSLCYYRYVYESKVALSMHSVQLLTILSADIYINIFISHCPNQTVSKCIKNIGIIEFCATLHHYL